MRGKKKEVPCCEICTLEDDEHAEDRMLQCSLCKVTVHAGCYSAEEPASRKEWFCFPCNTGFMPDQLKCAVCNRSGGAFKKVLGDSSTWAHAVCVNWIPEIDEVEDESKDMGPKVDLSLLDKARLKLQCTICNKKGGPCVQCAFRNCLAAVHPICLMKDTYDFVFRVVEGYSKSAGCAYYHREAYCPRHADFVGQPPKKGEMVIQLPCYSKFEVGDDYTPVLKDAYAGTALPFPTITASDSAANTPVAKKKGTGSVASASSSAVKVGQKRGRGATDDAPASPEPSPLAHSVPSKRPKVTATKASVTSTKLQTSPRRGSQGAKRGGSSATSSAGSSSSRGQSVAPAAPRESIYDIVERASMSAQKKDTRRSYVPLRSRKAWSPEAPFRSTVASQLPSTPKRTARASAPEDILVPPSPSLVSVASPEQQSRSGRGSQESAAAVSSALATPVSAIAESAAAVSSTHSFGTSASVKTSDNTITSVSVSGGTSISTSASTSTSAFRQVGPTSSHAHIPVRTASFPPPGHGKEFVMPGLPVMHKSEPQQPLAAADDVASGVSEGAISEAAPVTAPVSTMISAPAEPNTVGSAKSAVSAVIDSSTEQQLQAVLRQVLLGLLPQAVSAPSVSGGSSKSDEEPKKYRLCASSLPESTWATLHKAGWLCITPISTPSTSASAGAHQHTVPVAGPSSGRGKSLNADTGSREEIYVTPGTLLTSDDVLNFSDLQMLENVQYFGSLGAFRIHLAQNPCLLHPWARTWQTLQQRSQHGWRAHYPAAASAGVHTISRTSSTANNVDTGRDSGEGTTEPDPLYIYLPADAGTTGLESAGGSYQEESDAECDHIYGSASTRRRGSAGGAGAAAPVFVHNCIDGVHRFRTWREVQCYIHRFPYLLQSDATLTNTLLINGWRHHLRVKPEQHSSSHPQPSHGNNSGNVNDGIEDEFLWQGALILPHSREDSDYSDAGQDDGPRDGVWLGIDALKRHLWVEPTRLFRPYDRALSAICVTAMHVPSGHAALAPASDGTASSAIAAATATNANTTASLGVHASESDIKQLRAEFSSLLAEVAALKQSNAESLARAKKVEGRLERHRERKREKRERRRSGAVDSVISAFAAGGSGDPHHDGRGHSGRSYGYGQQSVGNLGAVEDQDQELESDYEEGYGDTV